MALAPVNKLKKAEIVWLANHYCQHGHTYLTHFNCFLTEIDTGREFDGRNIPIPHRVGFFDIETSNLNADYGICLCYCILDNESGKIHERLITKKELNSCFDKKVMQQFVKDIKHFDRLVGFYSTKFDSKFCRTRCVVHNIPFVHYSEMLHTDVYYMVRNKFKLHSNRLENACNILLGQSDKTKIDPLRWQKAMTGDQEALQYILVHCRADVTDLQKLYEKVYPFAMRRDTSI